MPDLLERLRAALAERYAVESEIGRGGMATVFLAEDLKHHRKVAIKVLHPELGAAVGPDRFLHEIEVVAGLTHPHVLPLHDSGEADGLLFYVMPYVEGESLRHRLSRERQLPVDEAIRITRDVAEALDHAHRHGLIHRDIKPGNILLEEGHAVVTDFGVARAVSVASGEKTTATGMAVGTPAYMSPEQAAGEDVDERSDIYALGCVLYEMLAGEPPLVGPTPQSTAAKRITDRPTPLTALRGPVPPELSRAVEKALERAPVDRYATALEFAGAFSSSAHVGGGTSPAWRVRRRAWIGLATAVVLGATAAVWLTLRPAGTANTLDPNAIAVLPFRITGTSEALRTVGNDIPDLFWMKVTGDYGPRAVDPATVERLWRAAGGSVEAPLSEAQALEVAQMVGAGQLVLGLVAGTEASMSLTATLLDVPSGRVRVRPTTVEGSYDDYVALSDAMITQLLAKDWGEAVHRLPALGSYSPEAVQAYMRGSDAWANGRFALSRQLFDRALEIDSIFVLAALAKYLHGESDRDAAAYAREHRDLLTERDQMLLKAVAGWRFGVTPSVATRIAQFDSIGLPDWEQGNDVTYNLHTFGRMADIPRWRERDRTARETWFRKDPANSFVAFRLFDLASDEGDIGTMRESAEALAAHASAPGPSLYAVGTGLRLAAAEGDTAEARRLWERVPALADSASIWLEALTGLLLEGSWLPELDRVFTTVMALQPDRRGFGRDGQTWARSRGRYPEWEMFREANLKRSPPVDAAVLLIRDVLFLREPEDSTVHEAVAWLEHVADGTISVAPYQRDPTPEERDLALSRCWVTLWETAHGVTERAPDVVRYLRHEVPLPYRWSVCAGMIDVLLAEQGGLDVRKAVLQLDSIVKPVPMEDFMSGSRDGTHFVDNLFLARKLVQVGDTAAALAAARRARPWQSELVQRAGGISVDLCREEARLALMVGDTAGAVDAYQHYFTLRDTRPDHPPWAAQWDSMRVEYAALTGVESH